MGQTLRIIKGGQEPRALEFMQVCCAVQRSDGIYFNQCQFVLIAVSNMSKAGAVGISWNSTQLVACI